MSVTAAVFQLDRSSEVNAEQIMNIQFMLVTLSVLTLLKSMLVQLVKPLNRSEQSPVNLTSLVAVTLVTSALRTSLPHLLSLLNAP